MLLGWIIHCAAALAVGGLVVRLVVRDTVPGLNAVYYATPWPVIAALAFLVAVVWAIQGRRFAATVFLALGLICAAMWVRTSFRRIEPQTAHGQLRVAYWNIDGPESHPGAVRNLVGRIGADVFGIGESKNDWGARQLGGNLIGLHRQMILASRFEGEVKKEGFLSDMGGYAISRLQIQGREVTVIMVDFDASPRRSRQAAFERLYQIVDAHLGAPLIVMGDFNTPADSVFFIPLRHRLRDAFETAGRGCADTWPMPLPVLSLDHIWVGPGLRVLSCEHRGAFVSDHRAVVADIAFE